MFFFFMQKTAYEMRISDWSSDVCSSDLLGQIVVNDQGIFAAITEVFAHGATRVGRQILHGGGVGRGGGNDNGVLERAVLFELAHHVADRGCLQIGRASWRESVCQYV